jgi:hypothetical protein
MNLTLAKALKANEMIFVITYYENFRSSRLSFFPIANDDVAIKFFVPAPLVSESSFGVQKL